MSRTRTATYSPEQVARRTAVRQATAELCAHLRAYGAKAATGRLTPERGNAKVTLPDSRVRVDVEVTVAASDAPALYTYTDPATGEARTTGSLRDVRRALAPTPSPLGRIAWRTSLVTVICAVVLGLATAPLEDTKHFLATHWLLWVAAVIVVDLVIVGGLELRRRRRRRKVEREALGRLGGVVRR